MTDAEIRALTPDTVPAALDAAGLLPPCVERYAAGVYVFDGEVWEPGVQIQDAWCYVAVWGLTIQPSHYPARGHWWVGVPTEYGVNAAHFEDIPLAICQAALLGRMRQMEETSSI